MLKIFLIIIIIILFNQNGNSNTTLNLTNEEKKWLKENQVINIAPAPNYPPFEFFDSEGQYKGITADYLKLFEKKLNIKFKVYKLKNWSEVITKTKKKEIDLWGEAGITEERKSYMIFTKPYLNYPAVFITSKKVKFEKLKTKLKKLKIIGIKDYASLDYLKKKYPNIKVIEVSDVQMGLKMVDQNLADAILVNYATAVYYIDKLNLRNLTIAEESGFVWKLAIACRHDWPIFLNIINKILNSLTPEEKNKIESPWLKFEERSWRPNRSQIMATGIFLICLVIFSIIVWNRTLSIKVKKKTLELNEQLKLTDEARKKADVANRSKSEFLANMSHEIRTPMNAILGFSEILYKTSQDEKQLKYISLVKSSSETLLNLINDILDLSKVEAGKLTLKESVVNLESVFQNIHQMFLHKIINKGIEFELHLDPKLSNLFFIDEHRLKQILFNIVGNASKFTEKGYIKINAKIQESNDNDVVDLYFDVEDTGIGIPNSQKKKIFDSFIQQEGLSNSYGGTGLGLTITKKILGLMNGSISVESEIGKGSKFKVVITNIKRIEEQSGFNINQDNNKFHLPHFKPAKILVVDDIENNRELIQGFLEDSNLEIYEAENGQEGVHKAIEIVPDLIIMDIKMPVMSGDEAIRLLKSYDRTKNIPIIVLSASSLLSEEEDLKKICQEYLRKPVQMEELLNAMANYLKVENQKDQIYLEQYEDLKIVLADDIEKNAILIQQFLEDYSVDLFVATNGKEAISLVEKKNPDLVIMDIKMPIMNGIEATRIIKDNKKFKELPIIAMTSPISESEMNKWDRLFCDYLWKPLIQEKLICAINSALNHKR